MKTAKTTLKALLLAAAAAAVMVALASCPNPVGDLLNAKSWGLLGTWVNPVYQSDGRPGQFAKLVVNADGTFRSQDSDIATVKTGTYVVDSVSVSGNTRTLKVHYNYDAGAVDDFVLIKVTDGANYESVYSDFLPYPSMILITEPTYMEAELQ